MDRLKGKVAVITGANSGVGEATALAFAKEGATVVISARRIEPLNAVADKIKAEGGTVLAVPTDISDKAACENLMDKAVEAFGKIDILVNSAGVVTKHDFWNTDEKEYDSIMDTNAKGTFFMSQAVGKQMVEKHIQGHILNVTSSSALRPAWTPYQMSKWAVNGLTQGLADMMIPHGIVVNAIAPGPTATPMLAKKEGDSIYEPYTPSHRYAMPEELASLALFMVSGAGNMIVGDTVYMTGGSGTITMHH